MRRLLDVLRDCDGSGYLECAIVGGVLRAELPSRGINLDREWVELLVDRYVQVNEPLGEPWKFQANNKDERQARRVAEILATGFVVQTEYGSVHIPCSSRWIVRDAEVSVDNVVFFKMRKLNSPVNSDICNFRVDLANEGPSLAIGRHVQKATVTVSYQDIVVKKSVEREYEVVEKFPWSSP